MKKFKTIIMLLLVAIALYAQRTPRVTNDFKEGDLIFQAHRVFLPSLQSHHNVTTEN